MADANRAFLEMFDDPDRVATYAKGPPRFMPGFEAVQRMAAVLLAEHAPLTRMYWCWVRAAASNSRRSLPRSPAGASPASTPPHRCSASRA